jgi:hypothetical protein
MRSLQAVLALVSVAAGPAAADGASLEAQVKAAYLFKLASFVRWPAPLTDGDSFKICVSGREDIASQLMAFANGKQIENRPVSVMQIASPQSPQLAACRMLFLGRGAQTASTLISATRGQPVLIVTDRTAGTRGGAVEFMEVGGKVRLAVDRREATSRKLALDSELFHVAAEVER